MAVWFSPAAFWGLQEPMLWFVLRKTSSSCAQRGSERMLWARRKNYLLVILSGQHKACLWRIVSRRCYLAVGSGEQSPGGRSRLFTPIAVALRAFSLCRQELAPLLFAGDLKCVPLARVLGTCFLCLSCFEMGSCCSLADPEAAICGKSAFRARVTLPLCFLSLFMPLWDQLVPHYV